jgi:hypothetical protein
MYVFASDFFHCPVPFVCHSVRTNNHTQHPRNHWLCFYSRLYIYKRCALHTSGYTMLPLSRSGAHRIPGCRGLLYGYICELMTQSRDSCRAAGAGLIHTVAKSRSGFSRHLGIIKYGHRRKNSNQFLYNTFLQVKNSY